jgi:uncharacterized protein with HEPN domain
MSKRAPSLYFEDIVTAIDDIGDFTQGMTYETFHHDRKTVNAVVRSLEIIGEAANHVPDEMRTKYSELPWKNMISMRNKVLHEYFGIDEEVIWLTITEDLRPLKEKIMSLPEFSDSSHR